MHQSDELEMGIDALESADEYEWLGEGEQEWSDELSEEAVFDEVEEMELAAELLEIQDEAELDEFLGKLIKRAGRAIGNFARSGAGKALGGVLKTVARKALPIAGAALGNLVAPGIGGVIGSKLASAGGRMFGLELEGMSPQDQEFEVARRFVRLSAAATRRMDTTYGGGSPVRAAKDAVLAAARVHAPGLVRPGAAARRGGSPRPWTGGRPGMRRPWPGRSPRWSSGPLAGGSGGGCTCGGGAYGGSEGVASRGTWVRRGNVVILRDER